MIADRVGGTIAGIGVVLIAAATLFPTPNAPEVPHLCFFCGHLGVLDVVLNLLLFVPLGLGLGVRQTRAAVALSLISLSTMLVEMLQFSIIAGRSATVSDVITNTVGGSLAFLAGRRWRSLVFPLPTSRRVLVAVFAAIFLSVNTLTGYSVQPSPTSSTFFGHYTRPYRNDPIFPGTVRSASVGACAVTNQTVEDPGCIGAALIRGDTFSLDVAARGTTAVPVAIVRVVDARQNEIVSLGSDRDRAIFSVRTKASALGLGAYRFALDSVFADRSARQVRVAGIFTPSSAKLLASSAGQSRQVEIRLGPASGWRMFIPWRYYDDGSAVALLLGGVWFAMLLVPIGFWGRGPGEPRGGEVALLMPVLLVGLLIGPMVFQTAMPSFTEVVGCAAGITVGLLARRGAERVKDSRPQPTSIGRRG